MTAFASHLNAANAARKTYGAAYKEFVNIEKVDGQWFAQVKQPMDRSNAVTSLVTPVEGKWVFPVFTAKPEVSTKSERQLEQEKAAQAFFNSRGMSESEQESKDYSEDEMRKAQELADKKANNSMAESPKEFATNADGEQICPCCGSSEIFAGINLKGLVEHENSIRGCHNCDWYVDDKKAKDAWVRQSTIEKPVRAVWFIADEMKAANPSVTRKEVQDECVRRGIASGTARTQYQAWKKANDATQANAELAAKLSDKFNGR
jgi:hypothetical protein